MLILDNFDTSIFQMSSSFSTFLSAKLAGIVRLIPDHALFSMRYVPGLDLFCIALKFAKRSEFPNRSLSCPFYLVSYQLLDRDIQRKNQTELKTFQFYLMVTQRGYSDKVKQVFMDSTSILTSLKNHCFGKLFALELNGH